jgi:hypothetical protein
MIGGRALRQVLVEVIARTDAEGALLELSHGTPLRRFIRPLSSLIRSEDGESRHHAVAALGWVTAELARTDLEAARDVVRRLMLTLTEESGGIGWGSPEAIGEILARHQGLAAEYASILLSYAREMEDGNYLEHVPLQRGVQWGLARLAEASPELLIAEEAPACLRPHLQSEDAAIRGLAARTIALLREEHSCPEEWNGLKEDTAPVTVYLDRARIDCRVQDMARPAVK